MMDASPYLNGQPVSEAVRRAQVQNLLVKGPSREAAGGPPPATDYKRKTLLDRKTRKA